MTDPMDVPPHDHGSDRYDYVEVEAPDGLVPSGVWWERLIAEPCPDCRANVFAKWGGRKIEPQYGKAWSVIIAHDDGCPTKGIEE